MQRQQCVRLVNILIDACPKQARVRWALPHKITGYNEITVTHLPSLFYGVCDDVLDHENISRTSNERAHLDLIMHDLIPELLQMHPNMLFTVEDLLVLSPGAVLSYLTLLVNVCRCLQSSSHSSLAAGSSSSNAETTSSAGAHRPAVKTKSVLYTPRTMYKKQRRINKTNVKSTSTAILDQTTKSTSKSTIRQPATVQPSALTVANVKVHRKMALQNVALDKAQQQQQQTHKSTPTRRVAPYLSASFARHYDLVQMRRARIAVQNARWTARRRQIVQQNRAEIAERRRNSQILKAHSHAELQGRKQLDSWMTNAKEVEREMIVKYSDSLINQQTRQQPISVLQKLKALGQVD